MKRVLMTELKEMNEKYQASQNALSQMEQKYCKVLNFREKKWLILKFFNMLVADIKMKIII